MRHAGHAEDQSIAANSLGAETTPGGGGTGGFAPRPSVLRALGLTLATQIVVGIATVLLYRLVAVRAGTEGFATFALVKQGVTLLVPVVTLGFMGGLPRYIALRTGPSSPPAEAYLTAAGGICGGVALATAALLLLVPSPIAAVFFGDPEATTIVPAFSALLVATAAFWVAYGYFRGQLQVGRANALHIVGIGLLPALLALLLPDVHIPTLVLLMAVGLGGLSLAAIVIPLVRALRVAGGLVRVAGQSLVNYGARRVSGDIAQVGLFALVPVLAAHVASLREVAYLAAGLQIVAMLAVALTPLGVVLLPALARRWSEDREATSQQVAKIAGMATHVGLFAAGQAVLFADVVVPIWLGTEFEEAGEVVRIIVLPVPLFAFYMIMRSALDAAWVRSYNSRSNISALAAFVAVAGLSLSLDVVRPVFCVAWAFAVGVTIQGLLTFVWVHRLFRLRWADYALRAATPLALVVAALGLAARPLVESGPAPLLLLIAIQVGLATIYFGGLARHNVAWIGLLRRRLRRDD